MDNIHFVDLHAQYQTIRDEIDFAIQHVIDRTAFIGGEEIRMFEAEFASFCEARACVGVANGTDAIFLALRALGIGAGDDVITVAHTFIASAEAITASGAKPVFVDVLDGTLLMNPALLEDAITPHTKAIIPVHLYGQPCQMDEIVSIAKKHGLVVIEDAAQAHGARWKGQRVGQFGDVACFSFYPGKNLGAYGDAGALVSQNEALIHQIRMLANHGRTEKYTHEITGFNSRLDTIQAAILRIKLRSLEQWNSARRQHAKQYLTALPARNLQLPSVHPDAEPVWHLFAIRTPQRDQLQAWLKQHGIETGVHYPIPLHLQPAYSFLNVRPGTLPVTEKAAKEVLSIPMYAELTSEQLSRIIETIGSFWAIN